MRAICIQAAAAAAVLSQATFTLAQKSLSSRRRVECDSSGSSSPDRKRSKKAANWKLSSNKERASGVGLIRLADGELKLWPDQAARLDEIARCCCCCYTNNSTAANKERECHTSQRVSPKLEFIHPRARKFASSHQNIEPNFNCARSTLTD